MVVDTTKLGQQHQASSADYANQKQPRGADIKLGDMDPAQHQALLDSVPDSGLKCDIVFAVIKARIHEEQDLVKRLRAVLQFNILKHGEHIATWTSDTKSSQEGDVYRSAPRNGKSDCTIDVDDDDFLQIMMGKLNPQRAFMMGKFKVKGNIMLLQKLHTIWYDIRRMGKTKELDMIQDTVAGGPILAGVKCEALAIDVLQRMVKLPHLVSEIKGLIEIVVSKSGEDIAIYHIDITNSQDIKFKRWILASSLQQKAKVEPTANVNERGKADARFLVDDSDLVLIVYGIYKVAKAVEMGKLTVEGDADIARRMASIMEHSLISASL